MRTADGVRFDVEVPSRYSLSFAIAPVFKVSCVGSSMREVDLTAIAVFFLIKQFISINIFDMLSNRLTPPKNRIFVRHGGYNLKQVQS